MERLVEDDSGAGVGQRAIEIEEARGRPPQVVGRIDTVASVRAPPITIVETGHGICEVATTDISLADELCDELLAGGGPNDFQFVYVAGRECVEHCLVGACCRRPEANRACDLVVPHGPRAWTPAPRDRKLVETKQRCEGFQVSGAAHPRNVVGGFVDDQSELHALQIARGIKQRTEHVAGNDARFGPGFGTLETICDVRESADSRQGQ